MTNEEIKNLQERVGANPDGLWGPKSRQALDEYLKKIRKNAPVKWPKPNRADMEAFYGKAGDEWNLVTLDFPFPVMFEGEKCFRFRAHKQCAGSLMRILYKINSLYSNRPDVMRVFLDYGGIFMNRQKRNGKGGMSVHSYGAAIDLGVSSNGFRMGWPTQADMPIEIIECFAAEGWTSGASDWWYDAMHFEAVSRP
jgi:hypothetical protein